MYVYLCIGQKIYEANQSQALDIKLNRQTWFEIYTTALGREVA